MKEERRRRRRGGGGEAHEWRFFREVDPSVPKILKQNQKVFFFFCFFFFGAKKKKMVMVVDVYINKNIYQMKSKIHL